MTYKAIPPDQLPTPRIDSSSLDELFSLSESAAIGPPPPASDAIKANGGGVFSSALSRTNYMTGRHTDESFPSTTCVSHLIYPSDGANTALA